MTGDDVRFLRLRWEVPAEKLGPSKWLPFAKGGEYSPYHDDVHLVLNWESSGREIVESGEGRPQNIEHFGKAGFTYPRRTNKRFAPRSLPAGCAFGDKGPAIIDTLGSREALLALLNSRVTGYLLSLGLGTAEAESGAGANSYEVGLVQRLPIPREALSDAELSRAGSRSWEIRSEPDVCDETSIRFVAPIPSQTPARSIDELAREAATHASALSAEFVALQAKIDRRVREHYRLSDDDWADVETQVDSMQAETLEPSPAEMSASICSYALGSVFGRWDIRLVTGDRPFPKATGAFDHQPFMPAGMLKGADGLPSVEAPSEYPIAVDSDGVLVDDESHPDDVVGRVREVLRAIWADASERIEQEIVNALDVKDLRDHFRVPRGFFEDHTKRYSKSRRRAPIYWLLQSARRSYGVWLYYPRLARDTPFRVVEEYAKPKAKQEAERLRELKGRVLGSASIPRHERTKLEADVERQEALSAELDEFVVRLERVAALDITPDLDDGVLLNIAPYYEVVPWKDARAAWEELSAGEHGWSSVAKRLRERAAQASGSLVTYASPEGPPCPACGGPHRLPCPSNAPIPAASKPKPARKARKRKRNG